MLNERINQIWERFYRDYQDEIFLVVGPSKFEDGFFIHTVISLLDDEPRTFTISEFTHNTLEDSSNWNRVV